MILIEYENAAGRRININQGDIRLLSLDGAGPIAAVNTSETDSFDGATFVSAQMPLRHITLMMDLLGDPEAGRLLLYDLFRVKQQGVLYVDTGKRKARIPCITQKSPFDISSGSTEIQISLLCPQPYFESLDVLVSALGGVEPMWEFPFELPVLVVDGVTTETGSGEKSPDNPYTLTGRTAAVDLSGTPFTLPAPLYSLPNGVADEWDADTGKGIRRVGKVVLDGSQATYGFNLSPTRAWASLTVAGVKPNTFSDSDSNFYCGKLTSRTPNQTWAAAHSVSRDIAGKITVSIAPDGIATAGDLLERLAVNPITVLYELAEPVEFNPVNLLPNSGFLTNLSGIYIGPNISRDPGVILQDCVALKSEKTSRSYVAFWDLSMIPAGTTVSFSIWYKTSVSDTFGASLNFGTGTHGYIGGKTLGIAPLIADLGWHKAEFTTTTPTVPAGAAYTRAEFSAPAGDIWFACPKLEIGPYATDWSPNPADPGYVPLPALDTGGLEFGRFREELIVDVPNASEADVGMTVVFFANSALTNPSIMNLNTGEALRLDTVMQAGDTITVTTHRGNKRITRTRGGVSDNLFNALSPGSVFLQLHQGNNPIRYNADTNLGGLELTIYHTDYYAGV